MNTIFSRQKLSILFISLFTLLGTLKLNILKAQDIQFSQFYAVDLYQNPAFAGESHHGRAMVHNRVQWPALHAKYTTYFAAYDQYFGRYNSGFGISVLHDIQSNNIISSTDIGLYYSYELHLSPQYTLRAGFQADIFNRSLDYSSLNFPSQFNNSGFQGGSPATNLDVFNKKKTFADLSTGYVFYNTQFWIGLAFHHLNQPNQTYTKGESRLPIKYSVTGGYKFILKQYVSGLVTDSDPLNEISITPTAHYKAQLKADQFDAGLYSNVRRLVLGVWYRGIPFKKYSAEFQNSESMVFIIGVKGHNYGISYSYDHTISTLARVPTYGSHEIHLDYTFGKHRKNAKPSKKTPCPKFYIH